MRNNIKNLVFEGGGVLGIAYLGVLDFLYKNNLMQNVKRVAGTSAGAITACIVSFGLPFYMLKHIADSIDYGKIPDKSSNNKLKKFSPLILDEIESMLGDINCIYRLTKNYGWYSSEYFYTWIKKVIASQFDKNKKQPPYTFRDFKNQFIHKQNRPFMDLYIYGTNISTCSSILFSYETTPDMEVAEAIRISMSIPLFFESIKIDNDLKKNESHIYSDGGVINNYPINLFDTPYFNGQMVNGVNIETLGCRFNRIYKFKEINGILDYIENLSRSLMKVQDLNYKNKPLDILRSIEIDTKDVSSTDFDIKVDDDKYKFLYSQGFNAANNYFSKDDNYM